MTRQVPAPPNVFDPASNQTMRIEPIPELDQEKTAVLDRSNLLAMPTTESTQTIDARALDLSAAPALPFRPGDPDVSMAGTMRQSIPRPADFTGTQTISVGNLLADAHAALPFGQAPSPVALAKPGPADTGFDLPNAFRAHLSDQASSGGQTIGETYAAGAFVASMPQPPHEPLQPVHAAVVTTLQRAGDPVILLYLHRPAMVRIVRKPLWQAIVDALECEKIDPETDDPLLSNDPTEILEQTRASAILKQGRSIDQIMALNQLQAAANRPGRFAAPLETFEGELEIAFDEIDMLRARLAMSSPAAAGDERLQTAITSARRLLESADTAYAVPLVRQYGEEVRQAYVAGKHSPRIEEMEMLVVRSMLERRLYQKRTVLGGEHLYARLHEAGQSKPLVVYIPAEAGPFLPLSARFRCRMIAEIHFGQDERESSLLALRCVAVGSVVRRHQRS